MMSSNVTSLASLTLEGFAQLSDHSSLLFVLLLSVYVFVLFADALVIYVICSQRSLRQPMFAFVAAVLLNSVMGSTALYPKLMADLLSGDGFVQVSRPACLCQAFALYSLGGTSFLLLSAMAFDRYLSICRPLRYAALLSPAAVTSLLLFCWLLPAAQVSGAVLLASRLPLCRTRFYRIYCDVYSFVSMSCGGGAALLSDVYGLLCVVFTFLCPVAFVLFSYGRVLSVCLRRTRSFSSKALHTCLPHLLVFFYYFCCAAIELLQRRMQAGNGREASVLPSLLMTLLPPVLNPVIYGLKAGQVSAHLRRLLGCRTESH